MLSRNSASFRVIRYTDKNSSIVDEDSNEEVLAYPAPVTTGFLNRMGHSSLPQKLSDSGRVTPYLKTLRDMLLYSFAFWGLVAFLSGSRLAHLHQPAQAVNPPEFRQGCDCGDSVAEAISLGCSFDSLSMAWLPEHCRDDELTAEFNTMGDGPNGTWIYYADTRHTEVVDVAAVAAMGDNSSARVHMSKDWHMIHCLYYWRKKFRMRDTGKIVEPRSDNEGHINHCIMVILGSSYGTISGVALNTNEIVVE